MRRFDYYQPEDLKEAFGVMERLKGGARYVAGGTDLICRIKQKVVQPDALISLRRIKGLRGIHHNGETTLGSMTILREIERDAHMARDHRCLAQAISVLATPQIRNMATLGGNLCNAAPSADSAPPLLVLEATLSLEGPGGRRDVPIEEFFTGPGQTNLRGSEVLTLIRIPSQGARTGSAFGKVGRLSEDIAIVNAAALLVMEGQTCRKCRLAVGAVAPVPLRLKRAEQLLEGRRIEEDILEQVSKVVREEVKPISDVRASEEYRRAISGVLVKRAILDAARALN